MSCDKNKSFQVANLFNELKTDGEKRIARLNLGVKDSDSLTWGNILGNIYDQEDLVYFVEMLKMLASLTGTVAIFRLNDNTIDRTILDIPAGWQDSLPDTTPQDTLWMTQAVKQGGIYKVGEDGFVWGTPIQINYSNVVDDAQQLEIDELRSRLNTSIQELQAINNLVDSMNLVTVNEDGSISVTGRDGQVSVWQHLDLGNYLMLGNIYGDSEDASTSYFLINKTGLLLAHNALIHGTIYATDGWFAGELRAATGSFKGEITATSGKIGGWLIIDGTLKPENVPTTALIGKILASQVDFGTTLTDLRSLILNDYTNKITSLRTSLEQNIELISSRFQVTSNSISSSVLEIRESLESQNLKIRTLQNALNKEKDDRNTLYSLLESKILLTSSLLSLGILETLLNYSKKFNDYVTSEQLSSEISLLSSRISAKVSQIEYNQYQEVIANKFADLSITPEQIQSIVTNKVTEATSSLTLTTNSLQAQITENGNLLSQLGITSDGIMMKGNTLAYYATGNITDPVFACNSDGSGKIAKGSIWWDANGNVTLSGNIVISWDDITDKPNIDPDGSVKIPAISNISPIYYKGQTAPSKPNKNTVISNESNPTNLWTTKIPTVNEKNQHLYKSNKITYVKSINDEGDTFTYTDVELDEAMETAQRAKEQLSSLFEEVDNGTTITRDYIYTGSFGALYAYVMNILSDTTDPKWKLAVDGSGFLADNNINWDAEGNLTVEGTINTTNGTIGGWEITNLYIQGSLYVSNLNSVTGMYDAIKSTTKLYNSGCIEINSKYGYATAESNAQQSMVGTTNNAFAGINEDGLYTSRESFTPESHYSTTRYYTNLIKVDGSGLLANGSLTWDASGNLTLNGAVNATSGSIGGWSINSDSLTSLVTDRPVDEESVVSSQVYTIHQFEINKGSVQEDDVISPYINITTTSLRGYTPLAEFLSVVLNADGLSIKNGSRNNPSLTVTTNYIGLNNGFLANNNISWDTENNVTIRFTLSSGNTTYDITLDNSGIHYVDQDNPNNRGTLEWTALIDNVS